MYVISEDGVPCPINSQGLLRVFFNERTEVHKLCGCTARTRNFADKEYVIQIVFGVWRRSPCEMRA